ncbi:MAG: Ig-like domain-containing protein [Proteobacteria bacterium]|nr:Ig-like domain-containing protein [Pseudomonadota bacterium]
MRLTNRRCWFFLACLSAIIVLSGCKKQTSEKEIINPLTIVSVSPSDGETDVPVTTDITITFSESVLVNGRTSDRIEFGDNLFVDVTIFGDTALCRPSEDFAYGTSFNSRTMPDIQNFFRSFRSKEHGNRIKEDYYFSFRTEDPPPGIIPPGEPPRIISTSPKNGSSDVPVDTSITFQFSEAIDTSALSTNIFDMGNGMKIKLTFNVSGTAVTLTPETDLPYNTAFSFTLPKTVVVSSKGVEMADNYPYQFTTEKDPAASSPVILSTSPPNGSTDVSVSSTLTLTFSEPIDTSGIQSDTLDIGNGISLKIAFNETDTVVMIVPSVSLPFNTTIPVTIPKSIIVSQKGMEMEADYFFQFTTEKDPSAVPPKIISTTPLNGAEDVPVTSSVTITFSEPIDTSALQSNTFDMGNGVVIGISFNDTDTAVTLTPSVDLPYKTTFSFTIPQSIIVSKKGIEMAEDYPFSFKTEGDFLNIETTIVDMVAIDEPGFIYSLNRNKSISLISTDTENIELTTDFPSWLKNTAGAPVAMDVDSLKGRIHILSLYSGVIASYDTETNAFMQSESIYYTLLANGIDMVVSPGLRRIYILYSMTDLFLKVNYYISVIDMDTRAVLKYKKIDNTVAALAVDDATQLVYVLGDTDSGAFITKFSVADDSFTEIKTIALAHRNGNLALHPAGLTIAVPAGNGISAYTSDLALDGEWFLNEYASYVRFSPDGNWLYASTMENYLYILNGKDVLAEPVSTHTFPNAEFGAVLAPEADGEVVAGFSYNSDDDDENRLYFFSD